MKFKLDFFDIEDFIKVTNELVESIGDIQIQIDNTVDAIKKSNEGKIIEAFEKINDEKIKELGNLKSKINNFNENVHEYYYEFQKLDEEQKQGEYKLDTSVINNLNKIKRIIKNINYIKEDDYLEDKKYNLNKNKNKYYEVDNKINLEYEYPCDNETQSYIIKRRELIEKQLYYYRYNQSIYDEVKDILNKLENEVY